jgi:uncharacterized protein
MYCYVDSSAFVKLIIPEDSSALLKDWLDHSTSLPLASEVLHVEVLRAVRRRAPHRLPIARHMLGGVVEVAMTQGIADRAAWLEPTTVRSLDAIHIATAMEVGDQVQAFLTYDRRMSDAASAYGFEVVAPGA